MSVYGLPPEEPNGEAHARWWWNAHNVASGARAHAGWQAAPLPAWPTVAPLLPAWPLQLAASQLAGPLNLATSSPTLRAEHVANVRGGHPWIHQIGAADVAQYQNPWFMRWEDAVAQWTMGKEA